MGCSWQALKSNVFQSTLLTRGETKHHFFIPIERLFQSTPLMRGETECSTSSSAVSEFQSTPLMRGETAVLRVHAVGVIISIHSPHTRGDYRRAFPCSACRYFNPLPSYEGRRAVLHAREPRADFNPLPSYEGRPCLRQCPGDSRQISIHSPHARGDLVLEC